MTRIVGGIILVSFLCGTSALQAEAPGQDIQSAGTPVAGQPNADLQAVEARAESAENQIQRLRLAIQDAEEHVRELQTLVDQCRSERSRDLQEFQDRSSKCETQVSELTAGLQTCNASLPTNVSSVAIGRLTDESGVISVDLNRGGFIRSRLYLKTPGGWVPLHHLDSGWSKNHILRFDKLAANSTYGVEIHSLDHARAREVSRIADRVSHPPLEFTTLDSLPIPRIDLKTLEASSKRIRFRATADATVRIRFYCTRYPEDRTGWDQKVPVGDPLVPDSLGNPVGGIVLQPRIPIVEECPAEAGQSYAIEWEAVSVDSGRTVPTPADGFQKLKTPAPPPAFAFGDPFSIRVSPIQFTVSWKPSVRPERAEVVLLLDDGDTLKLSSSDATITDEKVEITLQLPELWRKRTQVDPELSNPLRFIARMERAGERPVERRFEIGFEIGDKDLSNEQREAVNKLTAMAAGKRGKISWKEVVELGLPVILSFI